MHYVALVACILLICLAYGGHSGTFAAAFDAVTRGETARAADLFGDAMSNTLQDADDGTPSAAVAGSAVPADAKR